MPGWRSPIVVLLVAAALCVDLAGYDCRKLMRLSAEATTVEAAGGAILDDTGSGADCLCCSTLNLTAHPRPLIHADASTPLPRLSTVDPEAGTRRPPYRPPLV